MGGGDLFFHLTRRVDTGAGFTEDEARVLLAEIVLGLEHMHKHGFIHCDIKVHTSLLKYKQQQHSITSQNLPRSRISCWTLLVT